MTVRRVERSQVRWRGDEDERCSVMKAKYEVLRK